MLEKPRRWYMVRGKKLGEVGCRPGERGLESRVVQCPSRQQGGDRIQRTGGFTREPAQGDIHTRLLMPRKVGRSRGMRMPLIGGRIGQHAESENTCESGFGCHG